MASFFNRAPKSAVTSKRVSSIIEFMTYHVFKYVLRGFYEQHKFLFTLLLALKIDLSSGLVSHEEFMTLIKGIFDKEPHTMEFKRTRLGVRIWARKNVTSTAKVVIYKERQLGSTVFVSIVNT